MTTNPTDEQRRVAQATELYHIARAYVLGNGTKSPIDAIAQALAATERATVERCAKVVDEMIVGGAVGHVSLGPKATYEGVATEVLHSVGRQCAAAIRALAAPGEKDELDKMLDKAEAILKQIDEAPAQPSDGAVPDYAGMAEHKMLHALGDSGREWARAFCQVAKKLGHDIDVGWATGWFANAIERSSDVRRHSAGWRPVGYAWLVEYQQNGRITYYRLGDEWDDCWTTDANHAVRFARKVDAENLIDHYGWTEVKAVEHGWDAEPGVPTPPARG